MANQRPLFRFKANTGVNRTFKPILETSENGRGSRFLRSDATPKLEVNLLEDEAIRRALRISRRQLLRNLVPRLSWLWMRFCPLESRLGQIIMAQLNQSLGSAHRSSHSLAL